MRYLAKTISCAVVLAAGMAGLSASPASALVGTCSNWAIPGCTTTDGHRSYIESRSSKTGAGAAHICAYFAASGSGLISGGCAYNTTFVRNCYYGGLLNYGSHVGSSSEWIVNGRTATASDANVC